MIYHLHDPVFEPLYPARHLEQLQTSFGTRSLYESICFCNRCAACTQSCPTFRLSGKETDSPRGRNQMARLILEGKLKLTSPGLQESLNSCTLCGRCIQYCPGKIPTMQHVLEMRRARKKQMLPGILQTYLSWRGTHPILFKHSLRLALHVRFLWKIAAWLPGFSWLKQISELLPKASPSLENLLKKQPFSLHDKNAEFIYIPSLEAEFLQPEIALISLQLLARKGRTSLWKNTACGLFEYVYADLRQSRRLLRRLIRRFEENKTAFLVTDSLDVYHFLKLAPQVFSKNKFLQAQAHQLAANVRFITDFFPEQLEIPAGISGPVRLETSALFSSQSTPILQNISLFETLFKQNFVECEYTDFDIPAFGYRFTTGNQYAAIELKVAQKIAQKQTKNIFTFSGLCALELNATLRRFYPAARAHHIVCITDNKL